MPHGPASAIACASDHRGHECPGCGPLVRGSTAKEIALSTVTPDRLVLHHPTAEVIKEVLS